MFCRVEQSDLRGLTRLTGPGIVRSDVSTARARTAALRRSSGIVLALPRSRGSGRLHNNQLPWPAIAGSERIATSMLSESLFEVCREPDVQAESLFDCKT